MKGHRLDAILMGGYAAMLVNVDPREGAGLKKTESAFEYGGRLIYGYGHHFGISLTGSNNPFIPFIGKVHGTIPWKWSWMKGYKPWLEADFLLMHPLTSTAAPGMAGAAELKEYGLHFRALAGVPLVRAGPVAFAPIAGGEMSASAGSVRGTGLFGLAMISRFKGVDLYLAGLSSLEGKPLVLLRLGYSR